ncbi:MAG: hypothetical protein ACRDHE_10845 [Ktedonobacterales bacterium]
MAGTQWLRSRYFADVWGQVRTHLRVAGRDAGAFWTSMYVHLQFTDDAASFTARQAPRPRGDGSQSAYDWRAAGE